MNHEPREPGPPGDPGLECVVSHLTAAIDPLKRHRSHERVRGRLFGHRAPLPRLGRYVLLRRIGHGAMGAVELADDPQLDRRVAIKLIRHEVSAVAALRHRLLAEARALARVDHPNVVKVFDSGTLEDRAYIVMEYLPGKTLERWLLGPPSRPAQDIIAAFVAAGRGLCAIHGAGLVHRDFKPSNVLVTPTGRVVVADLGLAADTGAGTENRQHDPPEGTPGYMPPEQRRGGPVTAAADQYALCRALRRALRQASVPLRGHRLRRMQRVLERGLDPDPARRYESMEATLDALSVRPRSRAPAVFVATVCLAVVGAIAPGSEARCEDGLQRASEVWNESRRATLREEMLASGAPYATDTFARVEERLDRRVAEWSDAAVELCRASADAPPRPRTRCLDRRLAELDALIDAVSSAEPNRVRRAIEAVDGLDSTIRCEEDPYGAITWLDPVARLGSASALSAVDRSRVALLVGDYARARAQADTAVRLAAVGGTARVRAEAGWQRGRTLAMVGQPDAARVELENAHAMASGQGQDRLAAEIATELVYLLAFGGGHDDDARWWSRHAEVALVRAGALPTVAADLGRYQGLALAQAGQDTQARAVLASTLDRARRELDPDHPSIAALVSNLAVVSLHRGDHEAAHAGFTEAVEIMKRRLGPEHPDVGAAIDNLGIALQASGRITEAISVQERAKSILEAALGPDHVEVAIAWQNLGDTLAVAGRDDEAASSYGEALSILKRREASDHRAAAGAHLGLAKISWRRGERETARRRFGHAIDVLERRLGPEHPDLVEPLLGQAEATAASELDTARALITRAIDVAVQSGSSDLVATARSALAAFETEPVPG